MALSEARQNFWEILNVSGRYSPKFRCHSATIRARIGSASDIRARGRLPNPAIGATLLLIGGGYQLTPIKHACLRTCRYPLAFLMSRGRNRFSGAFGMGLEHGAYCVGCC
jgi:hypothetical protein